KINPRAKEIDAKDTADILKTMNTEDMETVLAVSRALEQIKQAADDAYWAVQGGGSIIYVGAGTSGRLGVLDASEMPPTFNVPQSLIRAIIAGGQRALTSSVEGAEDDEEAGRISIMDAKPPDMILGLSASGGAPFVLAALKEGKRKGLKCWLLTCNELEYDFLDGTINVITGPEIIAGSTRLKAGTATKLVLNMLSTTVMIKLGRVYNGYMIDVVPSNKKLKRRSIKIIQEVTGCSDEEAIQLFKKSNGNSKRAILMHLKGVTLERANTLLTQSEGSLRKALLS
ncbi:MAG: N-acetylmuramic acid 6-phosphate etherase, partial [Candidatus Magnetoovum sp. WYHC-5]|nr:N-acetylmuramic acid 6-phosphate etherase [Candidatus Magnetoovum sp. WYHC-5]